jgi:HEAT repeat protein
VQESESLEADARVRAEAEARLKAEQVHFVSSEQDVTANFAEPLAVEPSVPEYLAAEIAWPESGADKHYENGNLASLPIEDDAQTTNEVSADETPSKGIDVVFAEKGIVAAEDDGGIPSDVLSRLNSLDPAERQSALADVVRVGGDDAFRCISRAFDDQSVEVRNAAACALFDLQPDRAATFTRALREGTPERRRQIGQALAGSGLAKGAIANLTGESREKTYDAFSLLFLMAKAGEVQPLMEAIEDYPNVEVRIAVVKLLALSGQPEIVPAFRRMAVRGSLPSEVRSAVMEAIYQIGSHARETAPSAA